MTEDRGQSVGDRPAPLRSFEDLEVFKRSYRLALDVHRITLGFPQIEQQALADQMRRASKSICGNLAEGWGKHTRSAAEFKRFVLMALGSAEEMRVWLRFSRDLGYVSDELWSNLRNGYKELAAMLQGLHDRWH